MGKILGKSALCFVGLVIASWLLMQLYDWLFSWVNTHSLITAMLKGTILAFTLPMLLAIAYTYVLFRLFIREPNRYLIIALNGLFILVLFFILWFLHVSSYISYLDTMMVQVDSISVMALALMYKNISNKRKAPKKVYKRAANAMLILMKSSACMCLLIILALAWNAFMALRIPLIYFIKPFQDISFVDLLSAIVYSSVLYSLLRSHKHTFGIIVANSALLLIVWGLILLRIFPVSMNFSFTSFNTAILTPLLALIFRSIEKQSQLVAGASPPQMQKLETSGSTSLPVQEIREGAYGKDTRKIRAVLCGAGDW